MGNQFKVGDLAVTLTDCEEYTAGSVVELVSHAPEDHLFVRKRGSFFAAEDGWIVRFGDGVEGFFVSRFLMPLRGDFEPEQQNQREVEPCA